MNDLNNPDVQQAIASGKTFNVQLRHSYWFWRHSQQTTIRKLSGKIQIAHGRIVVQLDNGDYDCALEGIEVITLELSE